MRATDLLPLLVVCFASAACTDSEKSPSVANETASSSGGGKATVPTTGGGDEDDETPPAAPADCTGAPGELYALSAEKLEGVDQVKLCAFKGSVLLIVNGASACGYTPQYAPLQKLYAKYKTAQNKPFEVLAFPSRSFNQEKATDEEVSAFCTKEYSITFPLFTIGPVIDDPSKGEVAQPVYQWLRAQHGMEQPVAWNFEKFLISKDGKAIKRWLSAVSPDEGGEIDQAIAAELAK
jgi:glutathione peroxidase